jgi:hypothetical protein
MQRAQQPMIRSTDNSLQNRGKYLQQQSKGQMLQNTGKFSIKKCKY